MTWTSWRAWAHVLLSLSVAAFLVMSCSEDGGSSTTQDSGEGCFATWCEDTGEAGDGTGADGTQSTDTGTFVRALAGRFDATNSYETDIPMTDADTILLEDSMVLSELPADRIRSSSIVETPTLGLSQEELRMTMRRAGPVSYKEKLLPGDITREPSAGSGYLWIEW